MKYSHFSNPCFIRENQWRPASWLFRGDELCIAESLELTLHDRRREERTQCPAEVATGVGRELDGDRGLTLGGEWARECEEWFAVCGRAVGVRDRRAGGEVDEDHRDRAIDAVLAEIVNRQTGGELTRIEVAGGEFRADEDLPSELQIR